MFLKEVFRHSKLLFLLIVAFIVGQLFVVYNHGMVFSPLYNYWMYASRFTKSDSLPVVLVYSGGKRLKGSDYKQEDWDKILLSYQYLRHPEANQQLYGEIKRLTGRVGQEFGPMPFQMPPIGRDSLMQLWKEHASKVAGQPIDSVVEYIYYWNGQKLVPR